MFKQTLLLTALAFSWNLAGAVETIPSLPIGTIEGDCKSSPDGKSRIGLLSAFSGEADRLIQEMKANTADNKLHGCVNIGGHRYVMGKLRGQDVVIVLTNISITNATMITERTLDNFNISKVIYSGIAGGIGGTGANDDNDATPNEAPIGSVVIPKRWGYHHEAYYNNNLDFMPCAWLPDLQLNSTMHSPEEAAKTCTAFTGGPFILGQVLPPGTVFQPDARYAFTRDTNVSSSSGRAQYYTKTVCVGTPGNCTTKEIQALRTVPFPDTPNDPAVNQDLKFWFVVDDELFAAAQSIVGQVPLIKCPGEVNGVCPPGSTPLDPEPQLVVGQNGVAGPVFVDNAAYRSWVANYLNFDENGNKNADTDVLVLDMETTASAHVAYSRGVPFLGIRSVSDLAGGGDAAASGELATFFGVAAENQSRVVLKLLEVLPKK